MKQKEKELFKSLCSFKEEEFDRTLQLTIVNKKDTKGRYEWLSI